MRRKPNLFIIGAMKSGTTSLCNYLGAHPDIYMSPAKEPMHFSREENWTKGNVEYLKLFVAATDEAYIGEGSTEYSKLPFREGVAQRLFEFNPKARLVYLMRDPFERIVSQYKHMVRTGRETKSLSEAIKSPLDYLTNSYYAYQLRPYLELFGYESTFIDTFEKLIACPEKLCKKIFKWLKIDASHTPANVEKTYNPSPDQFQVIDCATPVGKAVIWLKQSGWLMRKLIPLFVRRRILSAVPSQFNIDFSSNAFQQEVDYTRTALQPILCRWVDELEEITGCSYPEWDIKSPAVADSLVPSRLSQELNNYLDQVLGAHPAHSLHENPAQTHYLD